MLPNKLQWNIIMMYSLFILMSMADERKRVFHYIKKPTIQTYNNKGNVDSPYFTTGNSVIACAAQLLQYGPFTCVEYHNVTGKCKSNDGSGTAAGLTAKMANGWSFYDAEKLVHTNNECKMTYLGREYRGFTNVTVTGIQCQNWGASGPHMVYPTIRDTLVQEEGMQVLSTNYCRNPDSEPGGPWCYTMYPAVKWQYCDVPYCHCYL